MRRPLRVALLTSARTWRGSGVSLGHIARGLAEHGHLPHVLAGEVPVVTAFAALGLTASQVPTAKTGIREALALAGRLRDMRADALLVDRPRDLRLGALASFVHPVAIVNRYNLSRENPPPDLVSRLAYQRVRLTVFVSETSAKRALDRAGYLRSRPHRVIVGAVDPSRFYPDTAAAEEFRRRHSLQGRRFVVAVGSLGLDKRYAFLVDAIALLGEAGPALVICGSGSLAASLAERAGKMGVDLRLPGHLTSDQLRGAYGAAACMVHAGAIETFGLSVLEAMACGSAVVAVRAGAVPEVMGDTGLLAPVDDLPGFAEHVKHVLESPSLRESLGRAALKRATQTFSLSEMRRHYVNAIEAAVD